LGDKGHHGRVSSIEEELHNMSEAGSAEFFVLAMSPRHAGAVDHDAAARGRHAKGARLVCLARHFHPPIDLGESSVEKSFTNILILGYW
jgi:hypothetical protein